MEKQESGKKVPRGSSPLKPLRSLSQCTDTSSSKGEPRLGTAQRVCKLLLERHGERVMQLLLSSQDGQDLLRSLLSVSFAATGQSGGTLLMRLVERDPESVVPVLFKKTDDRAVARGLGACLVRGLSAMEFEELRPVTAVLADAVMAQLQAPSSPAAGCIDTSELTPSEPTAAATVASDDDAGSNPKRSDEQDAAGVGEASPSDVKRKPSRVQELIEQQQRRCREQQEQQQQRPKLRSRGSGSNDSIHTQESFNSRWKGPQMGGFGSVIKEALLFATSEASSPQVEELCDQLVNFAPAVLTRIIQIEVARSSSSDRLGGSPSAAAVEGPQNEQQQQKM